MRFPALAFAAILLSGCAPLQFGVQGKSRITPTENKTWRLSYLTPDEARAALRKKRSDSAALAQVPPGGTIYFNNYFYHYNTVSGAKDCPHLGVLQGGREIRSKCDAVCRESAGTMGIQGVDLKIWCDVLDSVSGGFQVEVRDAHRRLETFQVLPDST